jgi:multisubunit Na+/H+ antiporter MnhG subunit
MLDNIHGPKPHEEKPTVSDEPKLKTPTLENSKKLSVWKRPFSRRAKIILLIVFILVCAAIGAGAWYLANHGWDIGGNEVSKTDTGKTVVCPLTGAKTTEENSKRRPIGVMVENSQDARPQSGLDKADLVYEVVAEGGITRFLAVYGCSDADEIGPVRSARSYYVDWVSELKAFYAHVGGSPDGLAKIKTDNVLDLDQFNNDKYFWRSTNKAAPHNVFTTTAKLRAAAQSHNWDINATFPVWKFKDVNKKAAANTESATSGSTATATTLTSVKIDFSSAPFAVEYIYDSTKNEWTRKIAGTTQNDKVTGQPIKVKNLAVMFTPINARNDGESRVDVDTKSGGNADIFIDGTAIKGTWKVTDNRTKFYDATGAEVVFEPGNIWISVVQDASKVSYK